MLLCLDVGNTHIYGGVFDQDQLLHQFRYPSSAPISSDVFGLFVKGCLRENGIDPSDIDAIAMGSVVPSMNYSLRSACRKYFGLTPLELQSGVKTGLNIRTKQPDKVGADRIATAMAAVSRYPSRHLIVIDFGTATTLCAISAEKTYLGGAILPGIQTAQRSLVQAAAQLMPVSIIKPPVAVGRTTEENIQSGIYYGQLGAVQALVHEFQDQVFKTDDFLVIATGGYAHLFEGEGLYDVFFPEMVLYGLKCMWERNPNFSDMPV